MSNEKYFLYPLEGYFQNVVLTWKTSLIGTPILIYSMMCTWISKICSFYFSLQIIQNVWNEITFKSKYLLQPSHPPPKFYVIFCILTQNSKNVAFLKKFLVYHEMTKTNMASMVLVTSQCLQRCRWMEEKGMTWSQSVCGNIGIRNPSRWEYFSLMVINTAVSPRFIKVMALIFTVQLSKLIRSA